MSRPIACEHGRGTVASDTQPILDYGWWASNGPTARYLMRLAADATAEHCPAHSRRLIAHGEVRLQNVDTANAKPETPA
jgi:hypothetical protein